jgi:hypothetical protein
MLKSMHGAEKKLAETEMGCVGYGGWRKAVGLGFQNQHGAYVLCWQCMHSTRGESLVREVER